MLHVSVWSVCGSAHTDNVTTPHLYAPPSINTSDSTLTACEGYGNMARTPWREALDAKIRIMRYFETEQYVYYHRYMGISEQFIGNSYPAFRAMASEGEPIWVAANISRGLAKNICDENTIFDMHDVNVPKKGFIWFEEPLMIGRMSYENETVTAPFCGVMYDFETYRDWGIHNQGMMLCGWQRLCGKLVPVTFNGIKNGESIEDWTLARALAIMEGDELISKEEGLAELLQLKTPDFDPLEGSRILYGYMLRYIYTLFSFMTQRIVVSPPTAVDRAARRDAERHKVPSEVRVITWRLKKYEKMETEANQVDWSCHWSSRAHERHLADGRVIPVRASIKGDKTKPYKPPTPNVHQVTRK
jgi:hypothetical protein